MRWRTTLFNLMPFNSNIDTWQTRRRNIWVVTHSLHASHRSKYIVKVTNAYINKLICLFRNHLNDGFPPHWRNTFEATWRLCAIFRQRLTSNNFNFEDEEEKKTLLDFWYFSLCFIIITNVRDTLAFQIYHNKSSENWEWKKQNHRKYQRHDECFVIFGI